MVVPTADRKNYLDALGLCDKNTGKEPYKGANATLEQIKPFYDYICAFVVRKLEFAMQLVNGLITDISETDDQQMREPISANVSVNVSVKEKIIGIIPQLPSVTVKELAKVLSVSERTINRQLDILKAENKIERVGSDKTGYWRLRY